MLEKIQIIVYESPREFITNFCSTCQTGDSTGNTRNNVNSSKTFFSINPQQFVTVVLKDFFL